MPNSPPFHRCFMNGPIFDHFLTSLFEKTHICAQIFSSEAKIVIYICKLCLQTAKVVYKNQRTVYEYVNILFNHMNRSFFFEDPVYDWGIFKKLARTPVP